MTVDYLHVERALSGVLPLGQLNLEEKDFSQNYKPVFEVGRLAQRMAQGYYAHSAVMMVAAGAQMAIARRSRKLCADSKSLFNPESQSNRLSSANWIRRSV
jgi:hypothetical protein